jgi:hypothetical protein
LRLDGSARCLNAERLQDAQDLVADRRIDAQAADRKAARGAVVHARTVAIVAADLAAVVHLQLAAAVAAPQQQRKLASLSFDAAGFGHGTSITHDASRWFRAKWGKTSSA